MTYALELGQRNVGVVLDEAERAYVGRTTGREGCKRAMNASTATKAWVESLASR